MKTSIFIDDEEVVFIPEQSVLDAALKNKINIDHSCGGFGTCGTCRIFIESDLHLLPSRNEVEMEMAEMRRFDDRERLACQTECQPHLRIKLPN